MYLPVLLKYNARVADKARRMRGEWVCPSDLTLAAVNTRPITYIWLGRVLCYGRSCSDVIENWAEIFLLVIVYAECIPIRFYLFSITQDFKNKPCHRSMHDQEFLWMAHSANGADSGAYCGVIFFQPCRVWDLLHSATAWTANSVHS